MKARFDSVMRLRRCLDGLQPGKVVFLDLPAGNITRIQLLFFPRCFEVFRLMSIFPSGKMNATDWLPRLVEDLQGCWFSNYTLPARLEFLCSSQLNGVDAVELDVVLTYLREETL